MLKQNKLFIGFRSCLLVGMILLLLLQQPFFITASLAAALFYAVYIYSSVLKNMKPYGGYANWLTLSRGIVLTALLYSFSYLNNMAIAVAGLLLALADVLDGWLARRLRSTTTLGALMDEETDAFYILVIGYILYSKQLCGFYILLPAFAKYGKDILTTVFAGSFCRPVKMPAAKWIAGISFILYLTPFVLTANIYPLLTVASSLALCLSFTAEMILRHGRLAKNQ